MEDNVYSIVFSPSSRNWSQQTQSGCVIENAVIGNLVINGGSQKISNSFLGNIDIWGGTPEISNNTAVGGIGVYAGSALIANNTVSQQYHYFIGYEGAIVAQRYDRNNNVIIITRKATPFVSGNIIIGNISQVAQGIGFETKNATITNNTIYGFYGAGISFYEGTGNALISDNTIYDCSYGISLNETGLLYGDHNAVATIQETLFATPLWVSTQLSQ
jgi:parallel beta-helix repeat protein